jgi:membrane protein implicated in regulation of membrane protease activity
MWQQADKVAAIQLSTRSNAMALSSIWWVLAGAAVIIELLTGTVYLLMFACGLAAAAIAAHLGVSSPWQFVIAGVVGAAAMGAWHQYKAARPKPETASRNSDVNLDIGQVVQVTQWATDGTAMVTYRGAQWQVRLAGPATAEPPAQQPGAHKIVEVIGSQLLVAKV